MKAQMRLFVVIIAVAAMFIAGPLMAGVISINFSENSNNQGFTGGQNIGPLQTNSTYWNNTNGQPNLATGTLANLIDETGTNTGAGMTWSSSNVWWNWDGTGNDEQRMAVGYLDDGAPGVRITVNDVPYSSYRVYLLLASDQGDRYTSQDFKVNGTWAVGGLNPSAGIPAFGNMYTSNADTGNNWSLADGTNRGNYLTCMASGSTLSIEGLPRSSATRGSITAVVIEVPEPSTIVLLGLGLLGLGFVSLRRR